MAPFQHRLLTVHDLRNRIEEMYSCNDSDYISVWTQASHVGFSEHTLYENMYTYKHMQMLEYDFFFF